MAAFLCRRLNLSEVEAVATATKPKKKMGRPSIRTPEVIEEICEQIAEGRSLASICLAENMPSLRSVMRWLDADPEFVELYDEARKKRGDRFGEKIGDITQMVLDGTIKPDQARVAMDGLKWAAARMAPSKYGDKLETTVNLVSTGEQHLSAVRELANMRKKQREIEDSTIDITADQVADSA